MGITFALTVEANNAVAFWPFSTSAGAAMNSPAPSSGTPALMAPKNGDPSAGDFVALTTSGDTALVSYSGPSGTIADVAGSPSFDRISVYVVRPGDTLSDIASMFNVSVNTIVWANNLKGIKDVHPGDTLVILPISGVEHKVIKGDTLKSLAKKYGADAEEIALFNNIDSSTGLAVGTTIIVPGGEFSAPTPTKSSGTQGGGKKDILFGGGGKALLGYFGNPLPGAIITQGLHGWNGIDIGARRGTPIYAAAAGTVIIARTNGAWNGGYGSYIVITHDNGSQTLYSHLSGAVVGYGQSILKGQLIGYVGTTGRVTGPHLHFEVRGAANPLRNCRVGSVCSPQ